MLHCAMQMVIFIFLYLSTCFIYLTIFSTLYHLLYFVKLVSELRAIGRNQYSYQINRETKNLISSFLFYVSMFSTLLNTSMELLKYYLYCLFVDILFSPSNEANQFWIAYSTRLHKVVFSNPHGWKSAINVIICKVVFCLEIWWCNTKGIATM